MKRIVLNYFISIFIIFIILNYVTENLILQPSFKIIYKKDGSYFKPYSNLLRNTEGSINEIADANGFNNDGFFNKKPVICVLGDSYTEALQVARKNNYISLLNNFFDEKYLFYNLGISGLSSAHFISYAKWYQSNFNCQLNIIFFGGNDFGDDTKNQILKRKSGYEIQIQANTESKMFEFKKKYREHVPAIIYYSYIRVKEFLQTTVDLKKSIEPFFDPEMIQWSLNEMRNQYKSPLILVYRPAKTPYPTKNGIIFNEIETNLKIKDKIIKNCKEMGIGFVDTTEPLNEFFKKTGRFPRGFSNTTPGSGHINEFGHKVVADTIADYLIKSNYLEGAK